MEWLADLLGVDSRTEAIWVIVGLGGQVLFMMRFLIQWIVSEREKRSVIPVAFWWFSIGGAAVLLAYAIYRQDPVFILGQSPLVYCAEKRGGTNCLAMRSIPVLAWNPMANPIAFTFRKQPPT